LKLGELLGQFVGKDVNILEIAKKLQLEVDETNLEN
jgi:hypothetical protein